MDYQTLSMSSPNDCRKKTLDDAKSMDMVKLGLGCIERTRGELREALSGSESSFNALE